MNADDSLQFGFALLLLIPAACGDQGTKSTPDGWTPSSIDAVADDTDSSDEADAWAADTADAAPDGTDSTESVVPTTEGPVRGVESPGNEDIWSFLGIPYAMPPTGKLRWRAPREPEKRDDVFAADSFGPACPQPERPSNNSDPGPTDEDCLTLNVWTPELDDEKKLPVMVWIHGGGFTEGSSRLVFPGVTHLYSGRRLAERDVVVVTLNYRLGPLGFFAHPDLIGSDPEYKTAGNYGFLDQVRALEWVRDNVANFGGDPENITLFGQSAGGISVCGHLVAKKSRGLFDRAIMQSGGCPLFLRWLKQKKRGMESAVTQGQRIAKKLECEGKGLSCLRSKSTKEIFDKLKLTYQPYGEGEQFGPIVDGAVFDKPIWKHLEAGEAADVPLMAGATADEGTLWGVNYQGMSEKKYQTWVQDNFPDRSMGILKEYPVDDYGAPWKAVSAILGDIFFTCPTRWALQTHVADGHRAYGYLFSHVTPYGKSNQLGAFHASELTFLFGNFIRRNVPKDAFDLSNRMQTYWTNFAKDADPAKAGGQSWPNYSLLSDEILEFTTPKLGTTSAYRKPYCDFWAQN